MAVNDLITFRKGTASAWTSTNPVLASGEPGYDLTNSVLKIGDGVSNWVALSGIGSTSVGGSSSSIGVRGIISTTGNVTSFAVSGGYPVGYLDLFQDGIKLVSNLDFSATDGSNVSLSNSVPSGTVLEYLTMASGVSSGGGTSGFSWSSVPATATSIGTAGSIAYNSNYFYIATANNTWKRSPLSTWQTDPYFSSVSLLLYGEGTNNSTVFTDSSLSTKSFASVGTPKISTSYYQFGSSSIYVDGSSYIYSSSDSSDFGFGSGDYTLEAWIWIPANNGEQTLIDTRKYNGATAEGVGLYVVANNKICVANNTEINITGPTTPTSTWTHIALVRYSGTVTLYVNGASSGWNTTDSRTYATSASVYIGGNLVGGQLMNGYIDNLRMTKGIARYTSNFTVPTSTFPND